MDFELRYKDEALIMALVGVAIIFNAFLIGFLNSALMHPLTTFTAGIGAAVTAKNIYRFTKLPSRTETRRD